MDAQTRNKILVRTVHICSWRQTDLSVCLLKTEGCEFRSERTKIVCEDENKASVAESALEPGAVIEHSPGSKPGLAAHQAATRTPRVTGTGGRAIRRAASSVQRQ